jgi:GNAT superfamily N-acetyltransferase
MQAERKLAVSRCEMGSFSIICRAELEVNCEADLANFAVEHEADIVYHADEGDDPGPRKVGHVRFWRVLISAARDAGEDSYEVCDAANQELHDAWCTLFSPKTRDLRPSIQDRFYLMSPDLLLIEWIELDPEWRGLGVGLLVLRRIIEAYAPEGGLVVCQPWTATPDGQARDDQGTVRLRMYLRRLGFRRVRMSPFYGFSTTHSLPSPTDLIKAR